MVGLSALASKIFGSSNDRRLKPYWAKVKDINDLESELEALTDEQLKARTEAFREKVSNGTKLDELLVPAFATVREAAKRTLGQRHFDVQLVGGMVLHDGNISEMKTGEGKTLVATLPVYLNALAGKGVHVVTVNDYLANRDAEWMGEVYRFLGLTTGVIVHGMDDDERQAAYACDVTYGTNNELGFDYLRDNMKFEMSQMVQRGHSFAIVDEVDSILIDEARTPLIISGPLEDQSELYVKIDGFIPKLSEEHYEVDEKTRNATLTESGNEFLEEILKEAGMLRGDSLYDVENVTVVHHINQAVKAHKLFQKDRDYIVKNKEVIIIDEFTGRMMPGRRFSEGLHQALEAKENVEIQPENQTLASITFQNYFRMYEKLGGMTGTAATEASEFLDIYGLDVFEIPTNRDISRQDDDDEVYRTTAEKFRAIIEMIEECKDKGQPVLVGTTSIEKSEILAELLKKNGFKQMDYSDPKAFSRLFDTGKTADKKNFAVLNARYHEQEAIIVSQAGVPGAITIATNMAGRGTDIQLGGNADMRIHQEIDDLDNSADRESKEQAIRAEVELLKKQAIDAGGLCIIGTERHESRRIDNQLRGRSGRQGDPGRSKFYLSLEDDLMRIFGSERMDSMLQKLGLEEGEAIVHPWINKALEKAQQKVEARNFDVRKNILKFDDVMNDQRNVIFEQRIELMEEEHVAETIADMRQDVLGNMVARYIPEKAYADEWETETLKEEVEQVFGLDLPIPDWAEEEGIADEEILSRLTKITEETAAAKEENFGPEIMRQVEKSVVLQTLDHLWREHLVMLEHLRQVVGLRGYGQRDPLNEYKTEAFSLFEGLLVRFREMVITQLSHVQLVREPEPPLGINDLPEMHVSHGDTEFVTEEAPVKQKERVASDPSTWGKVGRNEPCPCGSGKKYKHCHGAHDYRFNT